jgi:hypothetical protein
MKTSINSEGYTLTIERGRCGRLGIAIRKHGLPRHAKHCRRLSRMITRLKWQMFAKLQRDMPTNSFSEGQWNCVAD